MSSGPIFEAAAPRLRGRVGGRLCAWALCWAPCAALPSRQDAQQSLPPATAARARLGPEQLRLSLRSEPAQPYLHQPFELVLELAVEQEFLKRQLLQLFQRTLDLPIQLRAPGLGSSPGLLRLPDTPLPPAAQRASLVLGEELLAARRLGSTLLAGQRFERFELRLCFESLSTDPLEFAAVEARCAFATRFADDALSGSVPLDRIEATLSSEPLTVEVLSWPSSGQPPSFHGAVGELALEASVEPRELELGQSLRLELRISGHPALERLEVPRFEALEEFALQGTLERFEPGARILSFDLVPRSTRVRAVPALELGYFLPGPPPRYGVARSAVVPITVLAPAAAVPAANPAPSSQPAPSALSPRTLGILGGALLVLLGLVLVAARLQLRQRKRRRENRRAAREQLALELSDPAREPAAAFAQFLVRLVELAELPAESAALAAALVARGLPSALALRCAQLHASLEESRFGGPAPTQARTQVAALADELLAAADPSGL